jgi:hypothetical protein
MNISDLQRRVLAKSISPFNPLSLNPEIWLDGNDRDTLYDAVTGGNKVNNNGTVARWEDKSGKGFDFTQSNSANRAVWKESFQNNKSLLNFNGSNFYENTNKAGYRFLHTEESTIFIMSKRGDGTEMIKLFSFFGNNRGASADTGVSFGHDNRSTPIPPSSNSLLILNSASGGVATNIYRSLNFGTYLSDFVSAFQQNVYDVLSMKSDPLNITASNRLKFGVNGENLKGNNNANGTINNINSSQNLQIGAIGTGVDSLTFLGDYCELIIYKGLLSDADRQKVEGYLAWKWGTVSSLDINHPYKNNPPTK